MLESLTALFIHPELVIPGALLISAPIIIHFINRLRYRRVKWAAMEFLLASQQRNRRRLLLEQLLLLLLRILAVVGLALLIARPLVDPEQFALFEGQKSHHVVLIDDSGSMRDRGDEGSAFDAALKVVARLAAEGERKPDRETITLLLASNPGQPMFTQENLNKDFTTRLDTRLKSLTCSHRELDLAAGCEAARKVLADLPGAARGFHLVSDFRRHDWEANSALVAAIRSIEAEKATINLVKTVAEEHPNLGIVDLAGSVDVAAVNVPLRLAATVRNYGEKTAHDVRLTVIVDGQKRPAIETIKSIAPGEAQTIEFDEQFPKTGPHDVQVSLVVDALDSDNSRFLSIVVPDTNPVLVIDGNPDDGEGAYLVDALGAVPEKTGFSPTIDRVDSLKRRPLDRFQSIFLLNVSELPPDVVKSLEEYVANGGGLAWFMGPQVRVPFYNDKLYKEGQGIFPAKLGVIGDLTVDETDPRADFSVANHPIFEVFQGEGDDLLMYSKVTRYMGLARDATLPEGIQVIAVLRNKAPLTLEHRFGKGRVITFLTACGTAWTNWPRIPDVFVPVQLQLATYLAEGRRTHQVATVGDALAISLDAAGYSPQVEVRLPDGTRTPLTLGLKNGGESAEVDPAQKLNYEESFKNTDEPGVYAVVVKRQDGVEETRRYAYNAPKGESQLSLMSNEAIKRRLGPDVNVQIQEVGDFNWVHGEETTREIHDYVLAILLVVLLAEQAMALRLSYHPPPTEARA